MNRLHRLFHRHRQAFSTIVKLDSTLGPVGTLHVGVCRCGALRTNPSGKWEKR